MNRDAFDPGRVRHFGHENDSTGDSGLEDLVRSVIGAAIEVHRALGPGYLESIYEQALAIELAHQRIPFQSQALIDVRYRGQRLGEGRVDLLIDRRLVLELKTVESLQPIHRAQLMSYLKATDLRLGLLINFNSVLLKDGIERIICKTN